MNLDEERSSQRRRYLLQTPKTAVPSQSFFANAQGPVNVHDGHLSNGGNHTTVILNSPYSLEENQGSGPMRRERNIPDAEVDPNTELSVQKSCDIYYLHIAAKGHGSPLWIPQANRQLAVEYRRKGVQLGDIGILTKFGSFDFLFNIFFPAGHPMQPEILPRSFTPMRALRSFDIISRPEFDGDRYLASSSVQRLQHDHIDLTDLSFESSGSEGAVLVMPHRVSSQELANVASAKQYLKTHLENIYCYVNGELGREVKNGDICLVVGCDKTTAWGMAAFARPTAPHKVQLKFKSTQISGHSHYKGEGSGRADVKSGPSITEFEQLRLHPDSKPYEHENQCLFIRTLNSTLGDDMWNRLEASEFGTLHMHESSAPGQDSSPPRSTRTDKTKPDSTDNAHERRGTGNTSVLAMSTSNETIHTSEIDVASALHPSQYINEYLLRQKPHARMAITEDIHWISALEKNESILPPRDMMLERIMRTHKIVVRDDFVTLLLRNPSYDTLRNTLDSPKRTISNRTDDSGYGESIYTHEDSETKSNLGHSPLSSHFEVNLPSRRHDLHSSSDLMDLDTASEDEGVDSSSERSEECIEAQVDIARPRTPIHSESSSSANSLRTINTDIPRDRQESFTPPNELPSSDRPTNERAYTDSARDSSIRSDNIGISGTPDSDSVGGSYDDNDAQTSRDQDQQQE